MTPPSESRQNGQPHYWPPLSILPMLPSSERSSMGPLTVGTRAPSDCSDIRQRKPWVSILRSSSRGNDVQKKKTFCGAWHEASESNTSKRCGDGKTALI